MQNVCKHYDEMCAKGLSRMGKKPYQRLRKAVAKKLGIVDGKDSEKIEEACKIAYFNQKSIEGVQGNEQQWSNKAILASLAGYNCVYKTIDGGNGSLSSKVKIQSPPNFDPVFKILQFKR